MRRFAPLLTVVVLCAIAAPALAQRRNFHQPFQGPVTAAAIRIAIDDAVTSLRNQQAADGSIEEGHVAGGGTSLAALAMLASGAHPTSDDQLRRALDWLAKLEPDNTYVRGIRANVWEYALRKAPYEKKFRQRLKVDYDWLMKALGEREGWRYNMAARDWDNSCTQYGVLGVWAASRAGFDPGEEFWLKMSKHFRGCQHENGGWGYVGSHAPTPNMATAGLASMFLVFDNSHGRSFYSADNPRTFTEGEAAEVLDSIERGMKWLGASQGNKADGYYLYGIERTGVASGRKYIGGEDWFKEGAQVVLQAQQPDGTIPLGSWGRQVIGTSFCTLFLVYGGAPVAYNKLQYGDGHDWNLNPRDLANLSKELWSAYERPLNWQTVSIDAPAEEFDAPVLFISGSKAIELTEEEMLKLREYVLRGGVILAEPSDRSEAFYESFERLAEELFPARRYPGYKLKTLPEDHPIYTVVKQQWGQKPRLRGVSDGSRVLLLLSDEYLSADWQMNRTDSDAFKLATNLLFYATDLATLEGKFASILPASKPAEKREGQITLARVMHEETDSRDWDAAAMSWRVYAPYVEHVAGLKLKESRPVKLGESDLADVDILHLTGRRTWRPTAGEKAALKAYVDRGGVVLIDAYAGARPFAESAQKSLEEVFAELQPLADDSLLAEGRFAGGVNLIDSVRLRLPARKLLRQRDQSARGPKLLVHEHDGRPAVIFSEFDLSAGLAGIENYRAVGYQPASARRIVGNLLAYLSAD